jgi:hypothetical protein
MIMMMMMMMMATSMLLSFLHPLLSLLPIYRNLLQDIESFMPKSTTQACLVQTARVVQ